MRQVQGLTIDPPGARDLDDAIWLEGDRITVSVAAAGQIAPDSEEATQARDRGFTRYYSTGTMPMLPRHLAEDQLSLLPGRPRNVIAVRIRLDYAFRPVETEVFPAQLTSIAGLTYAEAADCLYKGDQFSPFSSMLRTLSYIADGLLRRRRAGGALAYYDLTRGFTLTEEGHIRRLPFAERAISYIIIQELMILANSEVASFMAREGISGLYRNHEARRAGKKGERAAFMHEIEDALAGGDLEAVRQLADRYRLVMERARYAPRLIGHYGLSLPAYTHFTSPIRRYADLVNHWAIGAYLKDGNRQLFPEQMLEAVGDYLAELSDEARLATSRYLKEKAMKETAENAATMTDWELDRLGDGEYERMIKVVTDRKVPLPEALEAALIRRLDDGRTTHKESMYILFASPADSEKWLRLRLLCLDMILRDLPRSLTVLSMARQILRWPDPLFATHTIKITDSGAEHTAIHFCEAAIALDARPPLRTERLMDTSIKVAKQKAATALIHLICGVPVPAELAPKPLPEEKLSTGAPAAPTKAVQPRPRPGLEAVAERVAEGRFINALQEFAAKRHERLPQYTFQRQSLPDGEIRFRCRGYLPDYDLEADALGLTKVMAKTETAVRLYVLLKEKLSSPPAAEPTPEIVS